MIDNLLFRPYQSADFDALEPMIFELYADEDAATLSISEAHITRTVRAFSEQPHLGEIFIFQLRGEVVGYAILTWFWSNEFGGKMVIIDELLVKEAYRGKGIASAFFNFLFKNKRYGEVAYELEVGLKKQKEMVLYHRLGFRDFKTKCLFRMAD
jgi:GNAT superfamily N-acetyltransferase